MVKLNICGFFRQFSSMDIDLTFSVPYCFSENSRFILGKYFFGSNFPESINYLVFENSDIS